MGSLQKNVTFSRISALTGFLYGYQKVLSPFSFMCKEKISLEKAIAKWK